MNVHDIVFTIGTAVLTLAAVPGARGKIQTPLATAVGFSIVIAAFTVNYLSMGYVLSGAICAVQTALWCVITGRVVLSRKTPRTTEK